jgi:hypothetical protein
MEPERPKYLRGQPGKISPEKQLKEDCYCDNDAKRSITLAQFRAISPVELLQFELAYSLHRRLWLGTNQDMSPEARVPFTIVGRGNSLLKKKVSWLGSLSRFGDAIDDYFSELLKPSFISQFLDRQHLSMIRETTQIDFAPFILQEVKSKLETGTFALMPTFPILSQVAGRIVVSCEVDWATHQRM